MKAVQTFVSILKQKSPEIRGLIWYYNYENSLTCPDRSMYATTTVE